MNVEILYQDQDVLFVNKPPEMVVTRSQTVTSFTLQDWMIEKFGEAYFAPEKWSEDSEWRSLIPETFTGEFGTPEAIFQERLGIAHRLDKDTSGVLAIGLNPGALVNMLDQFKRRLTAKTYLCLVHGKFGDSTGSIDVPIGRASHNRLQFAVQPEGKEATTEYQVLEYFPRVDIEQVIKLPAAAGSNFKKKSQSYQGFSLVQCWPKTGRTHQIRVHMAHLKHPLVGDTTYVGKKRQNLDSIWCQRHFLHASQLQIAHPRSGEVLEIKAPLPDDLEQVLTLMEQ